MTLCVNFGGERGDGKKMAFTFGRETTIGSWLRVRPRVFFDWENKEGVLPPELCDQHKHEEGTPMLLEQATVRNVSRAMHEINGFEWEGDFKPMARHRFKVSFPFKSIDLMHRSRYIPHCCLLEQHRGALLMFVLVAQLWR